MHRTTLLRWKHQNNRRLTGQLRYVVKNLIPAAFPGGMALQDVLFGPVQWRNLGRANQPVRIRLSSLAVDVRHDQPYEAAKGDRRSRRRTGRATAARNVLSRLRSDDALLLLVAKEDGAEGAPAL